MFYIGIIIPLVSLVIVTIYAKKNDTFDRIMVLFLGVTVINELISMLLHTLTSVNNTSYLYNTYTIIVFLLFFALFRSKIQSIQMKAMIKWGTIGLILFFIFDNVYNRNFTTSIQYHTFILGAVILIFIASKYLLELLQSDEIINYSRSKSFWVTLGILLFYIPFVPIIICHNFHVVDNLLQYITVGLNMIMHLCYIIGYMRTDRI